MKRICCTIEKFFSLYFLVKHKGKKSSWRKEKVGNCPERWSLTRRAEIVLGYFQNVRKIFNSFYITFSYNCKTDSSFLFLFFRIKEVSWNGVNIMVWNKVMITPPYKTENLRGDPDCKELPHIKKIVERHIKDSLFQGNKNWSYQKFYNSLYLFLCSL